MEDNIPPLLVNLLSFSHSCCVTLLSGLHLPVTTFLWRETHHSWCAQPVLGETRGVLGHRGSHYSVRSNTSLLGCEEEQEAEAPPLPGSPKTHVLRCPLPVFVLLGSVRRCKNANNFKNKQPNKTNECPWFSICYVVRSNLSAQCSAWLQVPLGTPFYPPPTW